MSGWAPCTHHGGMRGHLDWSFGPPVGGVVECDVQLEGATQTLPAVLWRPVDQGVRLPVVLLGHGGSGHKRSGRIVQLGRRFASAGAVAVAIDSPFHGERVASPLAARDYQARMVAEGLGRVVDGMVDDWLAAVDVLTDVGLVDPNRLAYVGLSLGTRFGIPLAARAGDSLSCAVLGKFGLRQSASMPSGPEMSSRLRSDVVRITAPVLFHLQWDDELFPRDGQLELFDLLPSADRQLVAYAGGHSVTQPGAVDTWCAFVDRHLSLRATGSQRDDQARA